MSEETKMDSKETEYYREEDILVTNTRAIFGETTYAMANISSVAKAKNPANRWLGILIAIAGVPFLVLEPGGEATTVCNGLGILLIFVGLLYAVLIKDKYIVRISSASGEIDGMESTDRAFIEVVVEAMNEAIIDRG